MTPLLPSSAPPQKRSRVAQLERALGTPGSPPQDCPAPLALPALARSQPPRPGGWSCAAGARDALGSRRLAFSPGAPGAEPGLAGWGRRIGGVPEAWERCRGESLQVQRRPEPTYSHVPEEEAEAQDTAGWDRKRERVAGCLRTRPTAPQTFAFFVRSGASFSRLEERPTRSEALGSRPGRTTSGRMLRIRTCFKMGCRGETERGVGR